MKVERLDVMKKIGLKSLSLILALILLLGAATVFSFAAGEDPSSGNYDEYFSSSSFSGCSALEVLSIKAASANYKNTVAILKDMGFTGIEANKYYEAPESENSVGVLVGRKKIVQDGKAYTLLAIVPRGTGYTLEWAGNMTVGGGNMHEGFKAARDEVLRFVKQYINKNDVNGSLKIWLPGYSRGAAVSNLVAGFLAGGGISYFGSGVQIEPEDIYCYSIATPANVKNGISKKEELSVGGKRSGADYSNDTEGAAFEYNGEGALHISGKEYGGIINIIASNDPIPLLPPKEWGFTRYGRTIDPAVEIASEAAAGGDSAKALTRALTAFVRKVPTNKKYAKEYQELVKTIAAFYEKGTASVPKELLNAETLSKIKDLSGLMEILRENVKQTFQGHYAGNYLAYALNSNHYEDCADTDGSVWGSVDEWAKEEMQNANEKGLIPESIGGKDFRKKIDRKDFAGVAVRLYEALSGKKAELPKENPFADTTDEYVLKAYNLGITNGTSDTTYGPGADITREEMFTMLARALEKAGIDTAVPGAGKTAFADDDEIHSWSRPSVYFMQSRQILKGVGDNKMNPGGNAKIEEAIAISLRCAERFAK